MVLPVKRWFALACLASLIAIPDERASAADDWKIMKVSGSDYLSVENISHFYGLPAGISASGEKVELETVKNPLEFVSGSREVMINGARSWLCFPVIEHDGKYLVSRTDVAKTIEPLVRPHRVSNVGKVQTVVLDPGHGGYDRGQVSRYGYEKDFALDVARKLRPLLQAKGLRVIMTREGDYFVPLEVRAQIANAARNSISSAFISTRRMTIPTRQGLKSFRLLRAERRPHPTVPWLPVRSARNPAAPLMRRAWPCRRASIIPCSVTSPSTTGASSARGLLC